MNFYKKIKPLLFLLSITLILSSTNSISFAKTADINSNTNDVPELTFDYIYESLQPFGKWYDTDEYGWVWRPYRMKRNWQPYTAGRWLLTEEGWLWQSSFNWGWLPFHYGNWVRHNLIGWCWVPDYNWAPAWVTWYWTDNFVGWAPIPPVPPGESYEIFPEDWFFVNISDFLSPYLYNYRIYYSVVSPDICVPYIDDNDCYFYNCCYYTYNNCRKIWCGPPYLTIEKNVKRKLKKKKVVTIRKQSTHQRHKKRNVVEVYRPTNRKKLAEKIDRIEKLKKLKPTDKATIQKAKPERTDENRNRRERNPNVHTLSNHNLPITPIKKPPKAKKRINPTTIKRTPTPPTPVPPAPPSSRRIQPTKPTAPPTVPPGGNSLTQPIQLQPPNTLSPR